VIVISGGEPNAGRRAFEEEEEKDEENEEGGGRGGRRRKRRRLRRTRRGRTEVLFYDLYESSKLDAQIDVGSSFLHIITDVSS